MNNKFLQNYEVLTDDGWKDFDGIKRLTSNKTLHILFSDNSNLKCTENHLLKINDGTFKEAYELKIGDVTSTGLEVTRITIDENEKYVYDLLNVKDTASYFTNEVISHNCAFVENWDDFAASVLPTISSGKTTKLLYTSTPNGLNHFYDYYQSAKKGISDFGLIEVKWNEVPGRDEEWKEEVLATLNYDEQRFAVEYEIEFMGSSGTLIAGQMLKRLLKDVKQPIHNNPGYNYRVYEEPKKGHRYCMTVDVSRGKGLDYSAFTLIDSTQIPYKVVATFKNNLITPTDFASFIYQTLKGYNDAMVLIEINDIGGQIGDILFFDYGYENIIHTESAGAKGKRVSSGFGSSNIDRGIRTSKTVKTLGCSMLKLLIEQEKLIIPCKEAVSELTVFSKKGNSYEAEQGWNDDLVMCLVLFAWLSSDSFFKNLNEHDVMHTLRDLSEEQIYDSLVPFGIVQGRFDNVGNSEPHREKFGGEMWETNTTDSLGSGWGF